MKQISSKPLSKQKGIGLIQVAFALLILSIGGVFAFQQYQETLTASRNNFAYEEASRWLGHMANMGSVRGHVYTGLDVSDIISSTPIEDATNVYGLTNTVTVTAGNWVLGFPTPNAASCQFILQRITGHPGLASAPTCDTSTLSATVE